MGKLYDLIRPQRLFVKMEQGSGLSLTQALTGSGGMLYLQSCAAEWCDMRTGFDADKTAAFFAATKGAFLPARVVVLGVNEKNITAQALKMFDYVLVPDAKRRNIPLHLRERILGYTP